MDKTRLVPCGDKKSFLLVPNCCDRCSSDSRDAIAARVCSNCAKIQDSIFMECSISRIDKGCSCGR